MQPKKGKEELEGSEIYSSAFLAVMAGSGTTATTFGSTVNHPVKNSNKLAILTEEIEVRFEKEEDLTFIVLRKLVYSTAAIGRISGAVLTCKCPY